MCDLRRVEVVVDNAQLAQRQPKKRMSVVATESADQFESMC